MESMPSLFIESGTLDLMPFSFDSPSCESSCQNGSNYFWPPIDEPLPYTAQMKNNIAYRITPDESCNLCMCTEDGNCYVPMDNSSYHVDFVSYCLDLNTCHIFGVVYHQPYFPYKSFHDRQGKEYSGPLPYLEPISDRSNYLKIVSVSCNGCQTLLKPRTCSKLSAYPNKTSRSDVTEGMQMPFTLTETLVITSVFGLIGAVSTFIYLFVLMILISTRDLWKYPVYKLMFHLGIFATLDIWLQTYYASSWGIWYGAYSRRFVIAGLNMISFGISSFTFALALNRWDVIAKPDFLRSLKGNVVSMILILLIYLIVIGLFVWQSLPGWGRFMVYLETPHGPYYKQEREYQNLTEYYIQINIELGLMGASIVLYAWCLGAIVYKRIATGTKLANKEKFLFIQTLTPCLVRVIANAISMTPLDGSWFLILTSALFFFEACHYPFLYLIFNQTIRYYLSRIFFKGSGSTSIVKVGATQAWATSR